jgi:hypothetical protein
MVVFNGAFPITPGKVDEARALAKEMMGPRRSGFDESEKRGGVTRETWSIQEMPDGAALALIWFESDEPEWAWVELAQDSAEFAVWFRRRFLEITGVDVSEPPLGGSELTLDWSA